MILAFAIWSLYPLVKCACIDPRENIDLSNRGLTFVNETTFKNCNPAAIKIDLSGNLITKLDANAFAYFDNSSKNYIQQFYKLEFLNLSSNKISLIDTNTFESTRVLKYLYLNNNKLTELTSGLFNHSFRDTLTEIDLSYNEIYAIEMSVFTSHLTKLKIVNLSHNNMSYMDAWPYIQPAISKFDLSHNKISKFTNHLNWTYDLREPYNARVDLRFNKFTIWDDQWLRQYQTQDGDFVGDFITYSLDMRENDWVCDCQIHYLASRIQDSFFKYAKFKYSEVFCKDPPGIRNKRIQDVDLNQLVCDVKVDCPFGCHCTNKSESKLLDVNCRDGNLTQLPITLPDIPDRAIILDVSNNSIQEISSRSYIDKLHTLKADNNKIIYIDHETIKNMTNTINSNNQQQYLPKSIRNTHVMNISNNQLQYLPTSIKTVNSLSFFNNPFKCNCNMTWMAEWITLRPREMRDMQVTCNAEDGDTHKIVDISEGLLNCNYNTEIGLAVGLGVIFILLVVGIIWAKKCPYETKVLIFKFFRYHPSDKYKVDRQRTKDYDVYVSFDDGNVHIRQWVLKRLKKRLEERKQRLFIPIIDLTPGEEKGEEMVKKMELSRRVIIILSDMYEENEWCIFECQQAEMLIPNEGRIIFIKYHPESDEIIKTEPWKSRVKDRKVLDIGETSSENRWFWDKLRYEIPVK